MQKVVVISGSSRGLGRALAASFGRAGYRLLVNGRDPLTLEIARHELARAGFQVLGVVADVSTREGAQRVVKQAMARFGQIDVLVNNAGALGPGGQPPLERVHVEALLALMAQNVGGPLLLTQAALPALRASGGSVLTVTSDAGVQGYPGWGAYGASKAAVEALVRSWAAEERGVRFHSIDPGDVRTDMHQAAFPGEDISDRLDPAAVTEPFVWLAQTPDSGLRLEAGQWLARQARTQEVRHVG